QVTGIGSRVEAPDEGRAPRPDASTDGGVGTAVVIDVLAVVQLRDRDPGESQGEGDEPGRREAARGVHGISPLAVLSCDGRAGPLAQSRPKTDETPPDSETLQELLLRGGRPTGGPAEVGVGESRGHAALRGAGEEALLDEKRLVDLLDGAALLA